MAIPNKTTIHQKIPEYVREFMKVVYSEAPDLAMDFFNTETIITDTTQLIKDLKEELQAYKLGRKGK